MLTIHHHVVLADLNLCRGSIYSCRWSLDGSTLATGSNDQMLRVARYRPLDLAAVTVQTSAAAAVPCTVCRADNLVACRFDDANCCVEPGFTLNPCQGTLRAVEYFE